MRKKHKNGDDKLTIHKLELKNKRNSSNIINNIK